MLYLCGPTGFWDGFALCHRHFNLAKQRHNLLRAEPLFRHDCLIPSYSLTTLGPKKPGQVIPARMAPPGSHLAGVNSHTGLGDTLYGDARAGAGDVRPGYLALVEYTAGLFN